MEGFGGNSVIKSMILPCLLEQRTMIRKSPMIERIIKGFIEDYKRSSKMNQVSKTIEYSQRG